MHRKSRLIAITVGAAVLGAAALGMTGVALAAPAAAPHPVTVYARVDGRAIPLHGFERVVRLPGGGVLREESFTWGAAAPPGAGGVRMSQQTSGAARTMFARDMAAVQAMQAAMDRQMIAMQRLMQVSFGAFAGIPAMPYLSVAGPAVTGSLPQPRPAAASPAPVAGAASPRYRVIRWTQPAHPPAKRAA